MHEAPVPPRSGELSGGDGHAARACVGAGPLLADDPHAETKRPFPQTDRPDARHIFQQMHALQGAAGKMETGEKRQGRVRPHLADARIRAFYRDHNGTHRGNNGAPEQSQEWKEARRPTCLTLATLDNSTSPPRKRAAQGPN